MIIKKRKHPLGHTCWVRCDVCGKESKRKASWAERSKNHYCSSKCRGTALEHTPGWKGGVKRITKDGYVKFKNPSHPNSQSDGYILEHRFVMSEHIERPLKKWEVVHHKNGKKDDNRIKNLELLPKQAEHIAFQKMEKRILELEEEVKDLKSKL